VAESPTFNCQTCQHGDKKTNMQAEPEYLRRLKGCGYLPPMDNARPTFGIPLACDVELDEVKVCPGYAISLPEVAETVRYRPSYTKGYLTAHVGESLTEMAIDAQNLLEGAVNLKQQADIKERAEEAKQHHGNR
jgi:hypothetical protein